MGPPRVRPTVTPSRRKTSWSVSPNPTVKAGPFATTNDDDNDNDDRQKVQALRIPTTEICQVLCNAVPALERELWLELSSPRFFGSLSFVSTKKLSPRYIYR